MKIEEIIRQVQRKLQVSVDGKAGPETWGAIHRFIVKPDADAKLALSGPRDRANDRSEKVIATLQPVVRPFARALYFKALDHDISINILSGYRSYAEQDALYASRTKDGKRVTKARGGQSSHNFGIAFDVGVFSGNRYLPASPKYKAVGVLGEELGLEWGGNWKTFVDQPHFQLRPAWAKAMSEREMLAEFRRRHDAGEGGVA